jgi:cytidylate kinase
MKTSVETYKNQAKAAQNNLVQARKEAWQTFEDDIKKCRELHENNESTQISEEGVSETSSKKEEGKGIRETILDSIKSLFN